ncbi:MAG: hypothetical protein ACLS9A_08940 [Clostridia bacterium]
MEDIFEYLVEIINKKDKKDYYFKLLYEIRDEDSELNFMFQSNMIFDTQIDREHIVIMNALDVVLEWDVDAILNFIKDNKLEAKAVLMNDIIGYMGEDEFILLLDNVKGEHDIEDFQYSSEPIIIMELDNVGTYYIIDGKHRLFNAYQNRNIDIKAYVFTSDKLEGFLINENYKRNYRWIQKLLYLGYLLSRSEIE